MLKVKNILKIKIKYRKNKNIGNTSFQKLRVNGSDDADLILVQNSTQDCMKSPCSKLTTLCTFLSLIPSFKYSCSSNPCNTL